MTQKLYTVRQAAQILYPNSKIETARQRIHQKIRQGHFPNFLKFGRQIMLSEKDIKTNLNNETIDRRRILKNAF